LEKKTETAVSIVFKHKTGRQIAFYFLNKFIHCFDTDEISAFA